MTYSRVEVALRNAATAIRSTQLGNDLELNAPGRRSGREAGSVPTLSSFELSRGIPVSRTIEILDAMRVATFRWQPSTEDRNYLQWIWKIHRFLQAVNGRFWGPIGPDVYSSFADADSAPPFACEGRFPGLRIPHPPDLRNTARDAGVSEGELRLFASLWQAARQTEVFHAAVLAHTEIRRRRRLLAEIRAWHASFRGLTNPRSGDTLEDAKERVRSALAEPSQHETVVAPLRAYNELIQVVLGLTLAWAERPTIAPVDPLDMPIDVRIGPRRLSIHATTIGSSYWFLKVRAPFELDLDGPLDGIYVCTGLSIHGLTEQSLVDVHGHRLRELEQT